MRKTLATLLHRAADRLWPVAVPPIPWVEPEPNHWMWTGSDHVDSSSGPYLTK